MYSPSQSRTLSVSCNAFPVDRGVPVLSPVRLRGTEALGKLYRYTLDMATTYTPGLSQYNTKFQIVPARLVGKDITISIEFDGKGTFIPGMPGDSGAGNVGAGVRTITGIIARVEMTGVDDRHTYYRLVVRPALWLTTKTSRSRIFQNRSVLDITRDVLREHPVLFDVKVSARGLKDGYPERDFVRQMWESDFHFLTRLWREWGIYYFEDNNRLVLCDGPGVHEPHRNAYDSIRYHAPDGARIDEEHIHKLKASRRITAARVTVVDYDYTRGAQKFVEEHDAFGELHKAEERHWGDYSQPLAGATGLSGQPNNYLEEAHYLAGVRAHALFSRNERLRGRGSLLGLKTGRTFFLTDHPESDVNAEYLVVSTTLDIRNVSETTISGRTSARTPGADQYQCVTDFVLQSPNRFFRNRLKKKPRCYAETAVVVGPKDQTTWVDAYGRVKICYPVSFNLGWHGGVHLKAPTDGTQPASVRAIADGKIVYVRRTDTTHKATLQYRNVRTDDGCVVIRHDTEIGEGDHAKITYYSVYMHMQQVLSSVAVGKKIYRKDLIGTPGQIYGQFPQIHFEIVCDEANLRKMIGRAPGSLGNSPARTDAVYGDVWFFVPRGTKLFANEPHPYREDDSFPAIATLHPQAPLVPAGTSRDLVIRMHYEKDCTLTTYQQNMDLSWSVSGAMPAESEAEYNLFSRATALSRRYTDSSLASITAGIAVPSPSAIFEMIRFGRCIDDHLASGARFNHWRKVRTPDGDGWINLSKAGVRVYSDADFPEWAGWSFVNDDPTPDSLCESTTVKRWLDVNHSGHVSHADAVGALGVDAIRQRLARAVCKFPSEWSRSGLEARYNWLKSPHEALSSPLSEADFGKLMDHARDLAFWEDISDPDLPHANEVWHFPPAVFIRHMRTCNWLGVAELAQCLPRRSLTGQISWNEAHQRATVHYKSINMLRRKYLGESTPRLVHFLAQAYIETGILSLINEGGTGHERPYGPFYGRGYLQLTWPSNYDEYGAFRLLPNISGSTYSDSRISATSTHEWSTGAPPRRWFPRYDPARIASNLTDAADSSGMFWVSKHFRGKTNINRAADLGVGPAIVGFISWLINGGAAGYANRQQFAALLRRVLADDTSNVHEETICYPPLTPPGQPALCHTFPPETVAATSTIQVNYVPQIP